MRETLLWLPANVVEESAPNVAYQCFDVPEIVPSGFSVRSICQPASATNHKSPDRSFFLGSFKTDIPETPGLIKQVLASFRPYRYLAGKLSIMRCRRSAGMSDGL